jgi:hypothetical protein
MQSRFFLCCPMCKGAGGESWKRGRLSGPPFTLERRLRWPSFVPEEWDGDEEQERRPRPGTTDSARSAESRMRTSSLGSQGS